MNLRRVLLLSSLAALGARGWQADRPAFEVASIKPWQRTPAPPESKPAKVSPGANAAGQPSNRVHLILPAALLIASAYNLPPGSEKQRLRGPGWLRDDIDQFEIEAKIPGTLFAAMQKMPPAQQREQVSLMEQSLLADRFKLKVHFKTVDTPAYALVVAKAGAKLAPSIGAEVTALSTVATERGTKLTAKAVTLDQFALSPLLTGAAGRPVLDQTGLKGLYDFTLEWEPEATAASDAPSFFPAILEQLGLRLVPSKAPVQVIVIDHVERPSAN